MITWSQTYFQMPTECDEMGFLWQFSFRYLSHRLWLWLRHGINELIHRMNHLKTTNESTSRMTSIGLQLMWKPFQVKLVIVSQTNRHNMKFTLCAGRQNDSVSLQIFNLKMISLINGIFRSQYMVWCHLWVHRSHMVVRIVSKFFRMTFF